MCTREDCHRAVGQWVTFQTQWGQHRGVVEQVNHRGVLMRVPQQYAPAQLVNGSAEEKLDAALLAWGGGYGGGYPGYGGGYGRGYGGRGRWGYPGYGAYGGGYWWWWLAFAWIFWLAFLW